MYLLYLFIYLCMHACAVTWRNINIMSEYWDEIAEVRYWWSEKRSSERHPELLQAEFGILQREQREPQSFPWSPEGRQTSSRERVFHQHPSTFNNALVLCDVSRPAAQPIHDVYYNKNLGLNGGWVWELFAARSCRCRSRSVIVRQPSVLHELQPQNLSPCANTSW